MYFPLDSSELSLYPDLFTICGGGVTETWSGKRIIPCGAVKFVILLDIYYFR